MLDPSTGIASRPQPAPGGCGADPLCARAYGELHAMAARHLRRERPDPTLQAADLVHEAWLKLAGQSRTSWRNREHFLGVADLTMRRILVDRARARGRVKRGGGWERVAFDDALAVGREEHVEARVDLDRALERFERTGARRSRAVELILFGGLTHAECAAALGVSCRTIERWWDFAQAWLWRELGAAGATN